MEVQHLSIIITSLALIISIWAKIEGSSNYQRQLRLERAKKVGDALISAQQLKNELSVCIEELNFTIEGLQNQPDTNNILPELRDTQAKLEEEYKMVWKSVGAFEKVTMAFERGEKLPIDATAIEAKVARFNQRKILAEHDIRYLKSHRFLR